MYTTHTLTFTLPPRPTNLRYLHLESSGMVDEAAKHAMEVCQGMQLTPDLLFTVLSWMWTCLTELLPAMVALDIFFRRYNDRSRNRFFSSLSCTLLIVDPGRDDLHPTTISVATIFHEQLQSIMAAGDEILADDITSALREAGEVLARKEEKRRRARGKRRASNVGSPWPLARSNAGAGAGAGAASATGAGAPAATAAADSEAWPLRIASSLFRRLSSDNPVDDANTNDPYVVLPDQLQALLSSAIRHKIQATNATVRLYQAGDVPVEEIDFVVSSGPSLRKPPSLNTFPLFRHASPTATLQYAVSCLKGGEWAGGQFRLRIEMIRASTLRQISTKACTVPNEWSRLEAFAARFREAERATASAATVHRAYHDQGVGTVKMAVPRSLRQNDWQAASFGMPSGGGGLPAAMGTGPDSSSSPFAVRSPPGPTGPIPLVPQSSSADPAPAQSHVRGVNATYRMNPGHNGGSTAHSATAGDNSRRRVPDMHSAQPRVIGPPGPLLSAISLDTASMAAPPPRQPKNKAAGGGGDGGRSLGDMPKQQPPGPARMPSRELMPSSIVPSPNDDDLDPDPGAVAFT